MTTFSIANPQGISISIRPLPPMHNLFDLLSAPRSPEWVEVDIKTGGFEETWGLRMEFVPPMLNVAVDEDFVGKLLSVLYTSGRRVLLEQW